MTCSQCHDTGWSVIAAGTIHSGCIAGQRLLQRERVVRLVDPLEGANCALCGSTADNFHVSDDLWTRVGLGDVQACFKCFRIAAWHAGVTNNGDPWEVREP